ncbi:hypothetical protein M2650_06465 [Luteimonas sp. SX5]|uniref:Nitrile hydratase subunit alpha n=1 Tax=Luteimonas galliterrae TaxID=2940486 RepID=A0ABT0MHC7_9GAMM|nr:hypothetical protein [Luteimonas galliterrae]MCL1634275.1 hypothetical protein [Luteimonas galliterrae]
MDPMSLEELALLDVLDRIDQRLEPAPNSGALRQRLIDSGLALVEDGIVRLSDAGIERCKSLHHRVISDAEAAALLAEREEGNAESQANAA